LVISAEGTYTWEGGKYGTERLGYVRSASWVTRMSDVRDECDGPMRIPERESPGYRCSPIMSDYNYTVELQTIEEESKVSTEVFGRVR
jgi:hypothetical protein